jgi:hypothetical protein
MIMDQLVAFIRWFVFGTPLPNPINPGELFVVAIEAVCVMVILFLLLI